MNMSQHTNTTPPYAHTICTTCKVGKIKLHLVPAIIQAHGHATHKGLHTRGRLGVGGYACGWMLCAGVCTTPPTTHLKVGCPKTASKSLIIQHLDLKGKVFLHVFDYHHQKGELDAQRALARGGGDVGAADVGARHLEHERLDIIVCETLDVPVVYCVGWMARKWHATIITMCSLCFFVTHTFRFPFCERFTAYGIENREKARLVCVFIHGIWTGWVVMETMKGG